MIIILSKKWTCATWWSLSFLDIFIRACTWLPPPLPSIETNHTFGREMIHCVQWMHPTPCVLSETALSGRQFIILAWHEAGKIPAADSPLLFFPLCYNSTFFVWLSLDLRWCLSCRVRARHWKTIHVWSWFWISPTHRQSIPQADSEWVEEELAIVQLVCLATLQEKPGHWIFSVWNTLGQ